MANSSLDPPLRVPARLRAWLTGNAWTPSWQPVTLSSPAASYGVAVAPVAVAAGVTVVFEHTFPTFSYHGLLGILAVLFVAVTWGLGPAILAAAVNAIVLSFVVEPPRVAALSNSLPDGLLHLITFMLMLAFGIATSLLSSLGESRRRQLIAQHADRDRLLAAEQQARAQSESALRRLQTVQAVTDASFARLPAQELFQHLLASVAQAISADAVALLLVSEDGASLLSYLAHGGQEGQAAETLLPIGQGFAGRIATSRQPLIVDDLSTADIAQARLTETSRSLAGAPITVQDHLLGVLQATSTVPAHFTAEDVDVLQLVADRLALVIENARLFGEERQRSDDLAAERDRLTRIVEMLPVGVVIVDADALITQINSAATGTDRCRYRRDHPGRGPHLRHRQDLPAGRQPLPRG